MAKKKSPRKKLKERCEKLVKEIVKIRDNYTCQICGKRVEGTNCHASHVIPVSAGLMTAYDPLNLKVLCFHHHMNFWHKNPIEAGEWFKNKFPERYEYLQERKKLNGKGTVHISLLEEWETDLKKQLNELK